MKTVTKFQADDGELFDTTEEAQRRDVLVSRVQDIERPLGSRVDRSNERKQHTLDVFDTFKRALVELCRETFPSERIFTYDPLTISPFSYAGRFLDDAAPRVLNHLWGRLMCMTAEGMEYQQPYYALHPESWTESPE